MIRSLISFAACDDRCARLRTSEATTAKPRPASPARAASTAALSASKLVCRAISSMTLMMSEILREEFLDPRHGRDRLRHHRAAAVRDLACAGGRIDWPVGHAPRSSSRSQTSAPSRPWSVPGSRPAPRSVATGRSCCSRSRRPCRPPRAWRAAIAADRVLQLGDGGVEIVPDLLVSIGEAFAQPRGQIFLRRACPVRRRALAPRVPAPPGGLRLRLDALASLLVASLPAAPRLLPPGEIFSSARRRGTRAPRAPSAPISSLRSVCARDVLAAPIDDGTGTLAVVRCCDRHQIAAAPTEASKPMREHPSTAPLSRLAVCASLLPAPYMISSSVCVGVMTISVRSSGACRGGSRRWPPLRRHRRPEGRRTRPRREHAR